MKDEKIKEIASIAWKAAANAHRLYPNNKHTFSDYWDAAKSQFDQYLNPIISDGDKVVFNEKTLRNEIARVWGEYGAHIEVFDMMLKKLSIPSPDSIDNFIRENYEIVYHSLGDKKELFIAITKEVIQKFNQSNHYSAGWISINDRLPNEGQIVLAHGNGHQAAYCKYENKKFNRVVDYVQGDRIISVYYDSITHWHELPSVDIFNQEKNKV